MRTDMRTRRPGPRRRRCALASANPRDRQFPFHCSNRAVCGSSRPTGPAWGYPRSSRVGGCWTGPMTCGSSRTPWNWSGLRSWGSPTAGRMPPRVPTSSACESAARRWWRRCRRWMRRERCGSSACLAGTTRCTAGAVGAARRVRRACGTGRREPRRAERVLLSGMSEPDRRLFGRPELAGRFGADLAGACSRGVVDEERLMPLRGGSRPNRSGARALVAWRARRAGPGARVAGAAPRFPVCDTTVMPGAGHVVIADHMAEIVGTVWPPAGRA
jgi:hypothetical protein